VHLSLHVPVHAKLKHYLPLALYYEKYAIRYFVVEQIRHWHIVYIYLSFLFVCTVSLTLVSDPTSRRFIRWLLFQTFIYYFSRVSLYYVFEYNPYKPIFMDYNFYFKDLRNIKQNLIKIDHHIKNL
jgi:hypothetical protein